MRKMLQTARGERVASRAPSDLESSLRREIQTPFKIPPELEQKSKPRKSEYAGFFKS